MKEVARGMDVVKARRERRRGKRLRFCAAILIICVNVRETEIVLRL